MMSILDMQLKKKNLGLTNQMIADHSGLPLATVQKIFSGATPHPRYATRVALDKAFSDFDDIDNFCLAEPKYVYGSGAKKADEAGKTVEDYLALPEDIRVELIDGVFYDMAAPTTIHQRIAFKISIAFESHVSKNGGNCVPFVAPVDVNLDNDDKTMVQPDVLIVCDRNKITRARIYGAPDLVVEVVSPSNSFVDTLIKLNKYKKAGVREYWIVFPDEKKVFTYFFEESEDPTIYSFGATVPVRIWNSECLVDFAEIYDSISFITD